MNQAKFRRDGLGREYAVILIDSKRFGLLEVLMDRHDYDRYVAEIGTNIYAARDDRGIRPVFRWRDSGGVHETALNMWVMRSEITRSGGRVHVINSNLLDCRKSNLELRNRSEIGHRTTRKKKASELPRGVTLSGKGNTPYMARIYLEGKSYFLGQFATPEEASIAYEDAKARRGEGH